MCRRLCLIVCCLFVAGVLPALRVLAAHADPVADHIGIYFDQQGEVYCAHPAPYTTVTAYLVATQVTEPSGLSAWVARIVTQPESLPAGLNFTLQQPGVSILPAPFFYAQLSPAVPRAPAITLLSMSTFYLGGVVLLAVGAAETTLFPADPGPGYAAGSDPTSWRRFTVWSGVPLSGVPHTWTVAAIGGGFPICIVDENEASTWGVLKKLYD